MKVFLTVKFLGGAMHLRKSACSVRGNLNLQITGNIATKDLPEMSHKFISNYHFLVGCTVQTPLLKSGSWKLF